MTLQYSDQEDYTEGSWKFWQKSDGDRRQKKEDKRAKEDEKKKMKEEVLYIFNTAENL